MNVHTKDYAYKYVWVVVGMGWVV